MEKLKRFGKTFKLRMSLIRIWFMKNILLFLKILCVVCLICIFTGGITAETPILGTIIYPIFAPLADEINAIIKEKEIDGLMTFFSIAISVMFSISMFAVKARNIAQADIKNPKLKLALVQANLYFNENGRLVKKVEKATGEDIDNDGKIDEAEAVAETGRKGIFKGIISAFQEFATIMKADLEVDTEAEADEKYAAALREASLEDAAEATEEIDEIITDGRNEFKADKGNEIADQKIEETLNDETLSEEEKEDKVGLLKKVKEWFSGFRKKKDENESDTEAPEVIEDNMETDSEIIEEAEEKTETVTPEVKNEPTVEVAETKSSANTTRTVDSFIASLKNRG